VRVHLDAVCIWRSDLLRKARLCSLYFIVKFLLFVQHKLSRNHGMLIYILQRVKICQGSGFYVLGDFVWCYLCSRLF